MKVVVVPNQLGGHPDLVAMLQAFYARSHMSIEDRLNELSTGVTDPDSLREKLEKYYVQYNHDSIGDGGHITLFIEGVSMLTAKAIQDHPLYAGQETSSRFIDFSKQPVPVYADDHYKYWMKLYSSSLVPLQEQLSKQMQGSNAIAVRSAAFDVARGLLPCGAQTQLSWHTSIRTLREHLSHLLAHPMAFVRMDAEVIQKVLIEYMPHMFKDIKPNPHYDWFLEASQRTVGFSPSPLWRNINEGNVTHPARFGTSVVRLSIDYGSYRDLQRHRKAYIKSTVPSMLHGPERWYLTNYPEFITKEITRNWDYSNRNAPSVPLMSMVSSMVVFDVKQAQYMIDLRTKPTVHPTMRSFMQLVAQMILGSHPNLAFMINPNIGLSDYDRRGRQTIMVDGKEIA